MEPVTGTGQTTVLYIGGMPRSGSTLLDLMLGQLPGHCDVGELFYLWQSGVEGNQLCACGRPFFECPFWIDVGRVAFGGWDREDAARFRALQASVDATSWIPLILAARLLPRFRRRLDEYSEAMTALYRAVADVSGVSVVVDSTKRPSLAFILRRWPAVDLRVVHLLRDPRGVVYSWTQAVLLPAGTGPRARMKTRSPWQISRRWVTVNLMIAALRTLGVRLTTVRYEDLVRAPLAELAKVAALTSEITGGSGDLGFITAEGLRLAPTHAVAGGRVRMRTGTMALRLDEAWREHLPRRTRVFVSVVTWPLRGGFGYGRRASTRPSRAFQSSPPGL